MDKVQAVEGMRLLDSTIHVNTAVSTGVALDHGARVEDGQLRRILGYADVFTRNDTDDREQGSGGLPALGAATGMVVGHVALEGNHHLVGRTVAVKGSAREVGVALGDAVIDERVERECHDVDVDAG